MTGTRVRLGSGGRNGGIVPWGRDRVFLECEARRWRSRKTIDGYRKKPSRASARLAGGERWPRMITRRSR